MRTQHYGVYNPYAIVYGYVTRCDIMAKEKIIHARIDEETHEKLFEKCNSLGCSFTEYIQDVIKDSLEDEPIENEPKIKELEPISQKVEPRPEMKNVRISYDDGKTWIEIQELQNIRIVD